MAADRHAEGAEPDLGTEEDDEEALEEDNEEDGTQSEDEQRHAAMLAAVRGAQGDAAAAGGRGGRGGIPKMVSEAYPESGYNLAPAGRAPVLTASDPGSHAARDARCCAVEHPCSDLNKRARDVRLRAGHSSKTQRHHQPSSECAAEGLRAHPAAAGEGGALRIADLVGALGKDRAKLGAARKLLERLDKRAEPVAPPLPSQVRARKERQAGYVAALSA